MKTILTFGLLIAAFTGFAQIKPAVRGTTYGEGAKAKGAISIAMLEEKLASGEAFKGRVKGIVLNVCEKKGCWMKLKQENGEGIMIRFKDYKFFMPKDIAGKQIIVDGSAKITLTSVDDLQHYAEDAGKSKEEIAKIIAPKKEVEFIAKGVLVL
ncbi:MAG: DUF4920 domain-containing protein [Chitinophagaceae bacterium]